MSHLLQPKRIGWCEKHKCDYRNHMCLQCWYEYYFKTKPENKMKPLVFDLFCGLGGWSEAFIAEGYRAVGFDIEKHDYGTGGYPGELVLCDVRTIKGADLVSKYGVPTCIVASPPCQEFSYMAMPWSKAKEKMRNILADPKEQERLTELFYHCFRIQREICAAAEQHIPMVVENVRGAQRWVGKSRWNFGSFHLWGDVPALMPFDRKCKGHGLKLRDEDGYHRKNGTFGWKSARTSSKSRLRKKDAAEIAKIPPTLATWIAKVFKNEPIPADRSTKAHTRPLAPLRNEHRSEHADRSVAAR